MDIHSWWVPYAVLFFGIWDLGTGISRAVKNKQGQKTKGMSSRSFIILGILFIITGIWSFWA